MAWVLLRSVAEHQLASRVPQVVPLPQLLAVASWLNVAALYTLQLAAPV